MSRWNGPGSVYIETICRDDCPDEKIIIVCPQWFADKLSAKEISIHIDRVKPPETDEDRPAQITYH